jgi:hypothetical protein
MTSFATGPQILNDLKPTYKQMIPNAAHGVAVLLGRAATMVEPMRMIRRFMYLLRL